MVEVEAIYCGGVCKKQFKDLEEAFHVVNRDFGPIYYDKTDGVHYAIVDGIEMYFNVAVLR